MNRLHLMSAAVIFALGLGLVATAHGEGFMSKVPTVGSSVTFDYKSTRTMEDGDEQLTETEIVIRCVGKEDTDEGAAYWIEIKKPWWQPGSTVLYKVLISEKGFAAGENAFAHIIRGFSQREEGQAEEISEQQLDRMVRFISPVPYFEELTGKETETLEIEAVGGVLECKVRAGESDYESANGNYSVMNDGKLWLNDDVPFGLIKAELSSDFEWGDNAGTTDTVMTIKKIEKTGAESEIPDAI